MNSIDYFPSPSPSQPICPAIRNILNHPLDGTEIGPMPNIPIDYEMLISHHRLNLLLWCNNKEGKQNDFECLACGQNTIGTIYYYCNGCNACYHKECIDSPTVFVSPYHPKYPLQLLFCTGERECHFCGKRARFRLVYYSSVCDLVLHSFCASKREFPAIYNHKRHEHTLHYFPRKASLTCDVCGINDNKICFYICHQCNFVVHITCVNLPRVIQISRHNHRLFFTYSLSFGKWSCGVCRQKIDVNYGAYSCSKGCYYAVHSKCATGYNVWDGKELEDQPEKINDNIKSFEEIGEGIIQHFSHPHHNMIFDEEIDKAYYEKKLCEACVLPIYDGNTYRCMQCDFVLHEECANLPRIKQNMVHVHQYILQPGNSESYFFCNSCGRGSGGFRYKCCEGCNSNLDVRCASLSEPVHHQIHPHPLFLLFYKSSDEPCSICGETYKNVLLNCVECVFALCIRCATLPYKVKYEVDEHLLTLSYEEDAISPHYVCEVCEENMDPKKGYYTCNECVTTLHIQCIVGYDLYTKPGQRIALLGNWIDVIPNNRLNRPICNSCQRRCQHKLIFQNDGKLFCSLFHVQLR